ncbi:hypothetical protein K474DRAFT_1571969, partial [Panus rudis PR-1116 ss-1]
ETSSYTLNLPAELRNRNIHPTFHIKQLRLHIANDDDLFPGRELVSLYDFSQPEDLPKYVEEVVTHMWTRTGKLRVYVRWGTGEVSWEDVEDLEGVGRLQEYYELMGVSTWEELPKN